MTISDYDFSDEVVESFLYNSKESVIELHFDAYYHHGDYIQKPCKLIICDWEKASSSVYDENKLQDLDTHIGVVSLVLSTEVHEEKLEMITQTLDGRYVTLVFLKPQTQVVDIN